MKVVKFIRDHSPYVKGETASFSDEDADVRADAGVVEILEVYTRQPDHRVADSVDEHGHRTKLEVRQVADDLERNVDLPPTEAGGRPKDEAHMTDEEKKRAKLAKPGAVAPAEDAGTKSVDQPAVNKMVNKPSTKK